MGECKDLDKFMSNNKVPKVPPKTIWARSENQKKIIKRGQLLPSERTPDTHSTVFLDLDETLVYVREVEFVWKKESFWRGTQQKTDVVPRVIRPGARAFLFCLKKSGYEIVLWTNSTEYPMMEAVKQLDPN